MPFEFSKSKNEEIKNRKKKTNISPDIGNNNNGDVVTNSRKVEDK